MINIVSTKKAFIFFSIYLISVSLCPDYVGTVNGVIYDKKAVDEASEEGTLSATDRGRSLGALRRYITGAFRMSNSSPQQGSATDQINLRLPHSLSQLFEQPEKQVDQYEESTFRPPYQPQGANSFSTGVITHGNIKPELDSNNCGIRQNHPRVVGGKEARENEFPWQVALKDLSAGVFCAGAIIAKRWIITAAHCLIPKSQDKPRNLALLRGLVGSIKLDDSSIRVIEFDKMITHPSYRPDTFENDIALLQTRSDIPLYPSTVAINTICLPRKRDANYYGNGTIAGWGTTSEGGYETPDTLLSAEIDLMDDSKCTQFLGDGFKQGKQICAGREKGGVDACQGDSGGSLIKEKRNKVYIIGIVSSGRGCGRARVPGIYTKVSHYINWISAQI